jgi:O-antigen/teichoic acid export membrane protein
VAAICGQGAAVAVAVSGGGVWALVSQVVVTQWVIAVLAWWSVRWLPAFAFSPQKFRQMATFGVRVSSVDLIGTARLWAESLVVTVTLGPAAMGQLNIGQRVVQVAQDLASGSLVPVSTVVFAKVREAPERLAASYLKALGVAYCVVSPLMVLITVTAPQAIPLVFGERWQASILPAQALSVAAIITLGAMVDHGLFYGLGRPGSWLAYALVIDALTLTTTVVTVRWGLPGVAFGFLVVAAVATGVRWVLVGRLLGIRPLQVARPFVTALVPAAVTLAVGAGVSAWTDGMRPAWLGLVLLGGGSLAVNLVLLRLVAGRVLRDALGLLPVPGRFISPVVRLLRLKPLAA